MLDWAGIVLDQTLGFKYILISSQKSRMLNFRGNGILDRRGRMLDQASWDKMTPNMHKLRQMMLSCGFKTHLSPVCIMSSCTHVHSLKNGSCFSLYIIGYICDALSVDPQSRCCPKKGEHYSCQWVFLTNLCNKDDLWIIDKRALVCNFLCKGDATWFLNVATPTNSVFHVAWIRYRYLLCIFLSFC